MQRWSRKKKVARMYPAAFFLVLLTGDSGWPAICITAFSVRPWQMVMVISNRAPGKVALPVGRFRYVIDTENLPMKPEKFEKFVAVDQFAVKGLSLRNREAGLGAPVIAVEKIKKDAPLFRTFSGPLFLRINCRLEDVDTGTCTGKLELYSTFDHTEILIGDKKKSPGE